MWVLMMLEGYFVAYSLTRALGIKDAHTVILEYVFWHKESALSNFAFQSFYKEVFKCYDALLK